MISIEQLIGDLLLRHNCVIIPSFGGFVAKFSSASIDYSNGVMSPPRKSLLFNRQLINNDGLLIAEFAVSNSKNYTEATTEVQTLVESWNEQLKRGERISIDKVGFLFYDQEKNICFEQDRFFNLLLESYGLGKVHFLSESDVHIAQKTTIDKALNSEDQKSQPVIVFNTETISINKETSEKTIIPHPAIQKKTKVWRYVAAACFLPIAFYSFWLPMRTDVLESGMISIKDFNPFYKSESSTYTKEELKETIVFEKSETLEEKIANLPEDVDVYPYEFDEFTNILVKIPRDTKTVEIQPDVMSVESSPVSKGNYEFIVGCFGSESNAMNLISDLKSAGINAYVVDVKNGLRRISAGNASSESDLQSIIQKAKANGYDGWVLKKQ
jgi:uncharacterized protein (UPF0335 family)